MRRLFIHGEITDETFSKFSKKLSKLLAQSNDSITLELHSEGGSPYAALAIYGRIVSSPASIHVVAYGAVMSAATIILAAGHRRSMAPETWFMTHLSESKADGNFKQFKQAASQAYREELQWSEILAKHSSLPASEWEKLSNKTTYLSAEQCLQYGIIDTILRGKK
jgi:ATP-dependent Clp protease protease subunit